MGRWLTMFCLAVGAMMATGVLGVASADPGVPAANAITTNGAASRVVAVGASDAERDGAYEAALAAAIDQAKRRAQFIATKLGVTAGAVTSLAEQSSVALGDCGGVIALDSRGGNTSTQSSAPVSAPRRPGVPRPAGRKHQRRAQGKPSSLVARDPSSPVASSSCPQYAGVTMSFLIA